VRLIEKYNTLHEEVATNIRSVLSFLPAAAEGTATNVLDSSYHVSGYSAEAADPVSARTTVPQD